MTRTLTCALGLGALFGSVPLQAAEDPGIALPPVPHELLLAANDAPGTIRHVSAEVSVEDAPDAGKAPAAALALGPKTIRVSPGTTAIVEVAIDHLNRIVTPFSSPQVRTVSRATTQVDGNAIYVATASEEPVSLFNTEAGNTATAISLTIAPAPHPAAGGAPGAHWRSGTHRYSDPQAGTAPCPQRPALCGAYRLRLSGTGAEPDARRLRAAQDPSRGAS
jgi:conjugal transfer pilus assembly protein TraK